MDDHTARRLRARAVTAAREIGFQDHAEDLAQDVLVSFISGRGKGQTVSQAVIDAVRRRFGRQGRGLHKERAAIENALQLDDLPLPNHSNHSDQLPRVGYIDRRLRGEARAMLKLKYEWGFTEREIGDLFGVSEGRINQKIREIQEYLRNRR